MRKTHLYLSGVACFVYTTLPAQETGYAYSKALAYATVASTAQDAAAANPAGLTELKQAQLSAGYTNQAALPDLNLKYASISTSIYHNILTFNINRYGIATYHTQSLGLSYARKLSNLSVGFKAQLNQLTIPIYGQAHSWSFTIGMQFQLTESIRIGSAICSFNPLPPVEMTTPTLIRLGIVYRLSDKLKGLAELDKINPQQAYLLLGLDYQIRSKLALRMGYDTGKSAYHFGFGLHQGKMFIDIASSMHLVLGLQPELSISYVF